MNTKQETRIDHLLGKKSLTAEERIEVLEASEPAPCFTSKTLLSIAIAFLVISTLASAIVTLCTMAMLTGWPVTLGLAAVTAVCAIAGAEG